MSGSYRTQEETKHKFLTLAPNANYSREQMVKMLLPNVLHRGAAFYFFL